VIVVIVKSLLGSLEAVTQISTHISTKATPSVITHERMESSTSYSLLRRLAVAVCTHFRI